MLNEMVPTTGRILPNVHRKAQIRHEKSVVPTVKLPDLSRDRIFTQAHL